MKMQKRYVLFLLLVCFALLPISVFADEHNFIGTWDLEDFCSIVYHGNTVKEGSLLTIDRFVGIKQIDFLDEDIAVIHFKDQQIKAFYLVSYEETPRLARLFGIYFGPQAGQRFLIALQQETANSYIYAYSIDSYNFLGISMGGRPYGAGPWEQAEIRSIDDTTAAEFLTTTSYQNVGKMKRRPETVEQEEE